LDFVRDNPGEPVPKETFTHSHSSWSSIIPICFLHLVRSSVVTKAVDVETKTKTEAAGFETEAEAEAVASETEAKTEAV